MTPYLLHLQSLKNGTSSPPEKKKSKGIAKRSEKRKIEDRAYKKIVAEMFLVSDRCEMKTPVCTKRAQGLHHKKKRSPDTLLDKSLLMLSCNACNLWVELHPNEAKEMGLVESKFN